MRLPSVFALLASSITVDVPSTPAWAHPGGLDASGCHTNRKTGEYHCHRGQSPPSDFGSRAVPAASRTMPFRNCTEARAAGAAPVRAGTPGYSRKLDRDGDGVGCE